MIKLFVDEWFRLINYCNKRDTFDPGIFSSMHDNYFKAWKKLDQAAQGEISERIRLATNI